MADGGAAGAGQGNPTGAGGSPTPHGDGGVPRVDQPTDQPSRVDPQVLYNRGFREGAEKVESRFAQERKALDDEIARLKGDKGKAIAQTDHDAALKQMREHYEERIGGLGKSLESLRQGQVRQELMRHARGANDPEDVAILLERRVRLNEQAGFDVLTVDGNKAIDPQTGNPLSVQQLVEQSLKDKPWLAKAPTSQAPTQGAAPGQVVIPQGGARALTREDVPNMTKEQYVEAAACGQLDKLYGVLPS